MRQFLCNRDHSRKALYNSCWYKFSISSQEYFGFAGSFSKSKTASKTDLFSSIEKWLFMLGGISHLSTEYILVAWPTCNCKISLKFHLIYWIPNYSHMSYILFSFLCWVTEYCSTWQLCLSWSLCDFSVMHSNQPHWHYNWSKESVICNQRWQVWQ